MGAFDAKRGSSFALIVMNEDNKTADVIPVGQHSWFSIISTHKGGAAADEEAQEHMAKREKINASKTHMISEKLSLRMTDDLQYMVADRKMRKN